MKNKLTILMLMLFVLGANIFCDQITKIYARNNFQGNETIKVIGNFFQIRYAENNGAFLSLGNNLPQPLKNIVMIILPLCIIASVLIYIYMKNIPLAENILICCILGGGISNLTDRIIFDGYVTDFLYFEIWKLHTGILNVADISVTFGALFLLILYKKAPKKPESPTQSN